MTDSNSEVKLIEGGIHASLDELEKELELLESEIGHVIETAYPFCADSNEPIKGDTASPEEESTNFMSATRIRINEFVLAAKRERYRLEGLKESLDR